MQYILSWFNPQPTPAVITPPSKLIDVLTQLSDILIPLIGRRCVLLASSSRELRDAYRAEALNWAEYRLYAKAIEAKKRIDSCALVLHTRDSPEYKETVDIKDFECAVSRLAQKTKSGAKWFQIAIEFNCSSGMVKHTSRYRVYENK